MFGKKIDIDLIDIVAYKLRLNIQQAASVELEMPRGIPEFRPDGSAWNELEWGQMERNRYIAMEVYRDMTRI